MPHILRTAALAIALAGAFFVSSAAVPTPAEAQQRTIERLPGTDIPGGDYRTLREVPLDDCVSVCLADTQCRAFTYNERARWCFLKSAVTERVPYPGATSAVVHASAPPAALPMPATAYLPRAVSREADELDALVSAVLAGSDQNRFVPAGVAQNLSSNLSPVWAGFADDLLSRTIENYGVRRDAENTAAGAAFLALRTATTPPAQARALRILSRVMERQGLFRPAIEASAASLTLALDAAERNRLRTLRRNHGFRVLDYAVDAEARTPRLCIQFSERLQGSAAALERFVAVEGNPNPTLSVDDKQLCVEGLEHGARYHVSVRDGLPSVIGEDLMTPADIRVYVRDRPTVARFDTNRYVLPATAAGIPVTTVNSDRVALDLYRINDRNLAETIRRSDFKRQLYTWDVGEVIEQRGEALWTGTLDVASVLNEEVKTLFPVRDVLEATLPGVYVLTAKPVEDATTDGTLATQWFIVSDLGLATYSGDGVVDVFARNLSTATPAAAVEVALISRNNAVIATATTDAAGHVRLAVPRDLEENAAPALVTAETADDYAFVSLDTPAFELTDRGVAGRAAPGPVDAFLATERGVYRAGETVFLTALVRDDTAEALSLPVTLKLIRPDGKVSRRITRRTEAAGGLVAEWPLTTNAATGTWTLSAHIDPDGPAVGTTRFLVEDFVPQRIEVALTSDTERATAGEPVEATIAADFLYGAPAADLMIDGSVTLAAAETVPGHDGYRVGLDYEPFEARRTPLEDLPRTGADGRATLTIPIAEAPDALGALEATIRVTVREPGGRQVGDRLTLPVLTGSPLIGVKPAFEGDLGEGETARFSVIALSGDLERTAIPSAEWTLTRIVRNYQWYRRNGRWFFDNVDRLEQVADGTVAIPADGTASIAAPVGWGRYRLEVVDPADSRVATAVTFDAGWGARSGDADTPDVLTVALDAQSYSPGDTARLRIEPRHAGEALVTVMSNAVHWHTHVTVPAEGTEVEIPVTADLTPGAYVGVTLVRPAKPQAGAPLPTRSVGIAHMAVGTEERRLAVTLDAPELALPGGPFQVPIQVDGLAEGEIGYLTVAAVDVGILNITGHTPPDVDGHYLGQRQLGTELRDLYGGLIDSAGAALGRVRSGGDAAATGTEALPPNEKPVSLFTGLIRTDAEGRATATFWGPPFNGTLRIMAIAWSQSGVGDASADTILRDPVVLSGTLPRFLAPGDATRIRLDVHNVSGAPGDYRLELAAGDNSPVALDGALRTFRLARDERTAVEMPLSAVALGTATITAHLTGPDGLSVKRDYTLPVRPAAAPVTERRLTALAPGAATTIGQSAAAGFVPGATVTLTVGAGPLDIAGLLTTLDRFPFGCAEQTVSRALPLIYANDLARMAGLEVDRTLPERIDGAIRRVLAYQSTAGGFGLWSPGNDMWLTAYVMDFLARAREAGYAVSDDAFEAGLDRLQSTLSYVGDLDGQRGSDVAYALYVLARNGRAAIGDLRYFAEEKWDEFETPIAKAQLAASVAFAGDERLSDTLFARLTAQNAIAPVQPRSDYGSTVRDAAASVTLAAESRVPPRTVADLSRTLATIVEEAKRGYSTQEAAWLVMSASATAEKHRPVTLDGLQRTTPVTETLTGDALARGVPLRNIGSGTLAVATTVRGVPSTPQPAVAAGLEVQKTFIDFDGNVVDLNRVAQNDRLLVRLTVRTQTNASMHLMLVDMLPAGFEIENPRLVEGAAAEGLPLTQSGPPPVYTEFRDDRFAAAWPQQQVRAGERRIVTYMVRAISPGTFALPAAEVSDMYQPQYVARTEATRLAIRPTR